MAEKPTARVTVQYDVAEKLAPQLLDILRGVPQQFPCKFVEPEAVPAQTPGNESDWGAVKAAKKGGVLKRILGKGK